jgi:beta-galactosidase
VIGEFVWTGFDYLGEPTPYDDFWPSRSSYFGICDLAGIPKDRYYLYRSRWRTDETTLHILPHWNWKGKEGDTIPVFVYTNHPSAELFINGKSQGLRKKHNGGNRLERYRLMWNECVYEPGTIRLVAYNDRGEPVDSSEIKTQATRSILADSEQTHKSGETNWALYGFVSWMLKAISVRLQLIW